MSTTRPVEEGGSLRSLEATPPRRRLSSRVSLLHIIAIGSGLLAFLLILSWMRAQEDVVDVMVAAETVRSGNTVNAAMFEPVEVPAAAVFSGSLVTPSLLDALVGSVATRTVEPGEPVLVTDFRSVETPLGLRAMSVPVDANRAVGGEIAIGDRVDVIGFDDGGARYIATDVEVLDVPGSRSGTFGTTSAFAVTIAVDDVQALLVAQALDFGVVHLIRATGAPEVTLDRLGRDAVVEDETPGFDIGEGD